MGEARAPIGFATAPGANVFPCLGPELPQLCRERVVRDGKN